MDIEIGTFDPETRQIPVTFTEGDKTATRLINASVDENGDYDEAATAEIIAAQARGVAVKFQLGVLGNAPPEPALPAIGEE